MPKGTGHIHIKISFAVLAAILTVVLAGCAKTGEEKEQVTLSIWSNETSREFVGQMVEEFKKAHESEAEFHVTISEESELSCKETVLANPKGAADIFAFADDQFDELCQRNALLEITEDTDEIIAENGGADSGAVLEAKKDGKLYAYPLTAGNGYFLYYDSSYFTKEDIKTMDGILRVAAKNKKKMMMDFSSGWYIYSFFRGAGLEVNATDEGNTNTCNWNATDTRYTGVDVAEAMLSIAENKGFQNGEDGDFVQGIEDGTVIAGINGAWNAVKVEEALGKNYAATKLPTYTVDGKQVQMRGLIGYKLVGVNSNTKYPQWAMKLARYISNEKNQLRRFQITGECPSNVNASASAEVQESPAIAALGQMTKYSDAKRISDTLWTPANIFGTVIANGNKDNKDLQELLDELVKDATKEASEDK